MKKKSKPISTSILIIDDQESWRQVFNDILITEGYVLEFAVNQEEAKLKLLTGTYGLAIIDMRLLDDYIFGYQGINLVKLAKERQIKTLVCTGFGTPELKHLVTHKLGADMYLEKGDEFELREFRKIVHHLLSN